MGGPLEVLLSFAAQHLWQSVVLLGCGVLVVKLQALTAEVRSWLLMAIFALAAIAPLAMLLPTASTPMLSVVTMPYAPKAEVAEDALAKQAAPVGQSLDQGAAQHRGPDPERGLPGPLASGLVSVWLLGSLWQLMRLLDAWLQARALRRSAMPVPDLERSMAEALPFGTAIALTAVDGPLVTGWRRPTILIPCDLAGTLDHAKLRGIVLHEVAHIERGDLWFVVMQRVVMAVYWWSPALRAIAMRWELTREMACDARAARRCGGNVDYADALLAGVDGRGVLGRAASVLAAGMAGGRGHLAMRIDGLLQDDAAVAPRRLPTTFLVVISLISLSSLVLAATPRLDLSRTPSDPVAQAQAMGAAVRFGDIHAVRRLVDAGADIDASVSDDGTALMLAIWQHDLKTAQALLDLGADPNGGPSAEGAPLLIASGLGYPSMVQQLIAAGADTNALDTDYAESPLIIASREGHLSIVKYLIAHGAQVNQGVMADWEGRVRTPLNQARDPAVRDYLISQGATAPPD